MIVLGIDLGKQGAVAVFGLENCIELHPTPLVVASTRGGKKLGRDDYDVPGMVRILDDLSDDGANVFAFVEKGQALPPKMGGGVANFQRGLSFGLWTGILAGLGIALEAVPPQTWQKVMLAGIPGDTKTRSAIAAGRLWPKTDFRRTPKCRKVHDGFTDAALIGLYGLRRMGTASGLG